MNPTIIRLGLRSVLGRRRGIMLFILPLILIGLSCVVRMLAGGGVDTAAAVLVALGLQVLVPLVALIATSSVVAPEIDDGSVVYLLAKPISRLVVITSKLAVALGCTVVFAVLPMLISGYVLESSDALLAPAYALGALAGGVAYCALFAWLSTLSRHAVVIGLIYVLLWEGLIGGLVAGVRWVSVSWWAGAISESIDDNVSIVDPDLSVVYALIATGVVLVGMTVLAGRRLRSFNLTGDE